MGADVGDFYRRSPARLGGDLDGSGLQIAG